MVEGFGRQLHVEPAVAALDGQSLLDNAAKRRFVQRAQLEYPAAREQGPIDGKVGILGSRPDQDHGAVFDPGQQRVLLCLVEAVDFVYEENGLLGVELTALLRLFDGAPDVSYSRQNCVDGDEVRTGGVGDDGCQGGLAGTGWSVKDQRGELVCLYCPPQQSTRTQYVILADELVYRAWSQPGGERLFFI